VKTYSKIHWTHLIIGLIAAGVLLVGVFFVSIPVTSSAEAATPKPHAAPPAKAETRTCTPVVNVKANPNLPDLVDPETFYICQDHGPNGHYSLIWKKASGATFATFKAEFSKEEGTPFVDQNGNDRFVFTFASPKNQVHTSHTKNLGLKPGEQHKYKYTVTICTDLAMTNCKVKDPGGIITP
jgi:hypothetical protein